MAAMMTPYWCVVITPAIALKFGRTGPHLCPYPDLKHAETYAKVIEGALGLPQGTISIEEVELTSIQVLSSSVVHLSNMQKIYIIPDPRTGPSLEFN